MAALNGALTLEDPRAAVPEQQKLLEGLNLRMYAASLQIYAKAYEQGTQRGLRTYADASNQVEGAELDKLRETLLGLYMQRVAAHIAGGDEAQARAVATQALGLDAENRTLRLQLIIATAMRNSGDARKALAEWEDDADYGRMRATVETAYAAKMMGIGQFAAARSAIQRAERYAPDLLETRLARAELQAETRFEGLKKRWAESWREMAAFRYPGGRINQYGQALAQLRWVQKHYSKTEAGDYLRGPSLAARMEALEARIKAFYPYEATARDDGKTVLVLTRKGGSEVEVKVQGPRREHTVKIPADGSAELEFGSQGLAVVDGRKPVFLETGVAITVDL